VRSKRFWILVLALLSVGTIGVHGGIAQTVAIPGAVQPARPSLTSEELAALDARVAAENAARPPSAARGAVAARAGGPVATVQVLGTANVFGAGLVSAPGGGSLPPTVPVQAGEAYSVDASGLVDCCGRTPQIGPDGVPGYSRVGPAGGLSRIESSRAMMLTGVFLGSAVALAPPPAQLPVTDGSFLTLSPAIGQVFFVGDGRSASVVQQFVAPSGATRMFLGIADAYGFVGNPDAYHDNPGAFYASVFLESSTLLSVEPQSSIAYVDTTQTMTVTLRNSLNGSAASTRPVSFAVVSGPNAGVSGTCGPSNAACRTNTEGLVSWSYRGGEQTGTDEILVFHDVNSNGAADSGEPQDRAVVVWKQFPSVQWASWHAGDVHTHAAGDSGLFGQQYCIDLKTIAPNVAEKQCADRNVKRMLQVASANKAEFIFFTEHAPWLGIPNDQYDRTISCWKAWDLSSPACVAALKAFDLPQASRQWGFIKDAASGLSPTTGSLNKVRGLIGEEMGTAPGATCTTAGLSSPGAFTAGHFGVYYTPTLVENRVDTCYEDDFIRPLKIANGFGGINHPGNGDKGSPWYCYNWSDSQPIGYETMEAFLTDLRKISAKKSLLHNLTQLLGGYTNNEFCKDDIADFASKDLSSGTVRTMEIVSGPHLPNAKSLRRWDALLQSGLRIGAVGGGDGHTAPRHFGVGLPFALAGQDTPNFGKVGLSGRTLVFYQGSLEPQPGFDSNDPNDPVRAAIGSGRTTATNGPKMTARVAGELGAFGAPGDTINRDTTIAGIPVRIDWDTAGFTTIGDTLGDPALNKEKTPPKPGAPYPADWPAGVPLATTRTDLPITIRVIVGSREVCRIVATCAAPFTMDVPLTDAIRARGWVNVNVPIDTSLKSTYVRTEAWYAVWPLPHLKDALSNAPYRFGAFTSPIYVDQKLSGSLTGIVRGNGVPQAGISVFACPGSATAGCTDAVVAGPDGRYTIPSLPAGTWVISLTPSASKRLIFRTTSLDLVTVKGSSVFDPILKSYSRPLLGDFVVNPDGSNVPKVGLGLPTITPTQAFKIRTNACAGGTVGVAIDLPNRSLPMIEILPGVYEASFVADQSTPANGTSVPRKGISAVTFSIACPGSSNVTKRTFDLYIDPAGDVVDQNGLPVTGATVTILHSDTERGTYLPVPSGDLLLAPHTPDNPELTEIDGRFRWDVAPGWYRVKAEKNGCVDLERRAQSFALSPPLQIPPPELAVQLTLYCGAIDATPPNLDVSVTGDRTPNSPITEVPGPSVTVNFTATDLEDPAVYVLCGVDEETLVPCTSPFVINGLTPEVFHSLTVIAFDHFGNSAVNSQSILIRPNQPPVCVNALASPSRLWPPNHQMVPVVVSGVTDPDGDLVTITVISAKQDEPTNGLGDGDTSPDVAISSNGSATVRSERAGPEDGRVYKLSFVGTDAKGGTCEGSVLVGVPKNANSSPVNSGATYDSLVG
jgi:hypothetical protein